MGLKERIKKYLRAVYLQDPNIWVHKSDLEQLCKDAGYLGDNGTRRLRELVQERHIETEPIGTSQRYRYIPSIDEYLGSVDKLT